MPVTSKACIQFTPNFVINRLLLASATAVERRSFKGNSLLAPDHLGLVGWLARWLWKRGGGKGRGV